MHFGNKGGALDCGMQNATAGRQGLWNIKPSVFKFAMAYALCAMLDIDSSIRMG